MANQQHIEWLLEGVFAWNARRKRDDFTPDLSDLDFRKLLLGENALDFRFRIPLKGINLSGANLSKSNFAKASLQSAKLQGANLMKTNLIGAMLNYTNLSEADLRGANLSDTDCFGTKVANARITTYSVLDKDVITNLTFAWGINQKKLNTMLGDGKTLIPAHLQRPTHWLKGDEPPTLPSFQNAGDKIDLSQDRLTLGIDPAPPSRSDLESIFDDIRHSTTDLKSLGNIGNMSQVFASALDRFLATLPDNYIDLEQVRFSVGVKSLRLRFESEKADLELTAPEKIGHIEAILYAADLLIARLPDWQAFLAEETAEYEILAADPKAAQDILSEAAEQLENAPDTFDPSLFGRIREYLDTKSIEGYLAGQALLANIAHKTFTLVLDFTKDTISATRKGVIIAIATSLLIELGGVLIKLASLLPKELQWLANWLEYLPKIIKQIIT